MKKFITAIVSLVLAGTMAFGLAACDLTENPNGNGGNNQGSNQGGENQGGENQGGENQGGENQGGGNQGGTTVVNKALLDAIDATLAAENYKLTMDMGADFTFLFNGELLEADTVIMSTPFEMTGADLITTMPGVEEFANPVHMGEYAVTYNVDMANYKFTETYPSERGEETEYYEVDGTSISRYYQAREYHWDEDTQESSYTYAPAKQSYTGYASNDATKALFKKFLSSELEGASLDTVVEVKVKGLGEHADREGTLRELEDLFEYDEATKTYSATVDASAEAGEDYAECTVKIGVDNGKVTSVSMLVPGGEDFDGMFVGLPEGLTVEVVMSVICEYSDYGAVTVTKPAVYDNIDPENIDETPVLSASALAELLADYNTTEFELRFDWEATFAVPGGEYQTRKEYYEYCVDTQSKNIMLRCNWYDENAGETRTYYHVNEGKLFAQRWNSIEDKYFADTGTDITGNEIDALIQGASSYTYGFYLTDYCAGFDEGELKDLVSKFEYTRFDELTAYLTLNGKDVKVEVSFSYNYNGEEYEHDIYVYVYYLDNEDHYFSLRPLNKDNLEYWHPDNWVDNTAD